LLYHGHLQKQHPAIVIVMADTELYRMALAQSTRPDLPTEHDEMPHTMPSLTQTDRAGCERWLQEINFLYPGTNDDIIWEKIKKNWIGYLSATSPAPDATLAPNRKVVQFTMGNESAGERRRRFAGDRRRRMTIQSAFWNGLDGIEAMTERWPRAARAALNCADGGEDPGVFESLAAVYDLGRRRRYQAVWTSLAGFIAHSLDEGTLEEMGLELNEDQRDDILDVEQEVWEVDLGEIARRREKGGFEYVWAPIQQLLFKALSKQRSTARNNPLVWWLAVLVRSAVSGERDFISSGRFHKNPMPMDVDLGGRVQAMVHYGKVLVLDDAFSSWSAMSERTERTEWVMEVQSCLNMVSIEWINDEGGRRPDRSSDGPMYSSAAWRSMVSCVEGHTKRYMGGKDKTAMYWVRLLVESIRQ
jgi:hypothetical protein